LKTKLSSVYSYLETSQNSVSNKDPLGDDPQEDGPYYPSYSEMWGTEYLRNYDSYSFGRFGNADDYLVGMHSSIFYQVADYRWYTGPNSKRTIFENDKRTADEKEMDIAIKYVDRHDAWEYIVEGLYGINDSESAWYAFYQSNPMNWIAYNDPRGVIFAQEIKRNFRFLEDWINDGHQFINAFKNDVSSVFREISDGQSLENYVEKKPYNYDEQRWETFPGEKALDYQYMKAILETIKYINGDTIKSQYILEGDTINEKFWREKKND